MLKNLVKSHLEKGIGQKVREAIRTQKEFADIKAINQIASGVKAFAEQRGFECSQSYELFYEIGRKLLPRFAINEDARIILDDQQFLEYFEKFAENNYKSFERRWNLKEFLKLVQNVDGDLAECGTYKGAAAFLFCTFAQEHNRKVHLFDSFQGLSEPGANDGVFWQKGNLSASEQLVHDTLNGFSCFKTYPGWIPSTFPNVSDRLFAFLHVDVDLEQPTYDTLEFFYPRLNKGAVVILDDHGFRTCPGARKAALEFMRDKPEQILDLSTGQGLIIKS